MAGFRVYTESESVLHRMEVPLQDIAVYLNILSTKGSLNVISGSVGLSSGLDFSLSNEVSSCPSSTTDVHFNDEQVATTCLINSYRMSAVSG